MDISTKIKKKRLSKVKRHKRVRQRILGTAVRPRFCVYKSLKFLYVQLIDDLNGKTLLSITSLAPGMRENLKSKKNIEAAKLIGKEFALKAQKLGVKKVVFDRGGYKFHGKVKALADSAREAGLEF